MTPESFDAIYQTVRPTIIVLPRLMPIMMIVPAFSSSVVTGLVRNGFMAIMTLFIAPSLDLTSLAGIEPFMWIVLVAKEALIGILLAYAFGAVMWAIAMAGSLIDFQTGSGNAQFFDPIGQHEGGPSAGFLNLLAITLFVTTGGLNLLLSALFESYKLWPVASLAPHFSAALLPFVARTAMGIMSWTVKLAAPVVMVLVLVELGMGLIGRAMPQLNVFMMSQPVKSAVAVLMMALFLPFVYTSLHAYLGPDNGLLDLLKSML
ncbi:type III secretion system export apparatus subunit SctT [Trinickia fusca]|uniref:EscT/YscT/HrcT family type III secretion system export apparatus protein n=1 Tax=Trinickia fusca TaxID=2419777 RepID=A0A494XR13_9BURK|nr:type III secretion system export apparatus subunit SctT [Trinickia fusca]RKP50594.1 EscT/YscT/HrcT family type III secretion system export apparatus protein [Trinickia fusca]